VRGVYFFIFGAFVALVSFLPRYYVGAYELELAMAGVLAGLYLLSGSVFRALASPHTFNATSIFVLFGGGGYLSTSLI
jgi:hypothetical protein